ncbi:DNA translocase FtsK [Planctomycetes bacterium K23_9]|uniref:DNA translocase FtsK n=1 Tax=Stieleria marina TaxID=1930275 RepID=A0A517NWK5_9BACT|nr:DNA translocase FtsK [Planctomycetes bacterium K23_9]
MSSEIADFETIERQPDFVRDVSAIILVAITLMTTVSVVTRNPADPVESPVWPISAFYTPDQVVYPASETITNGCGYWGALLSSALFDAFGMSTALLIAAGGGIATALLIRGQINAPVLRSLGGTIVVLAFSTASGMFPAAIEGMPVVGAGGYLGAMSSTFLLDHFAPVGAWILTAMTMTVGLLLTTDYAMLYAGRKLFAGSARVTRGSLQRAGLSLPGASRRRRQPFTDLEEPIQIDGDAIETDDAAQDENELDEEFVPSEPKISFRKPKRSKLVSLAAAGAAGVAAATGLASGTAEDEEDGEYETEEEYEDGEEDEEPDAVVREIEVDDEVISVRGDEAHDETPQPKIRLPRKNRKKEQQLDERQQLFASLKDSAPMGVEDYHLPNIELLEASDDISYDDQLVEVRRKARILEATFKDFGFNIRVVEIETGPVIAQYEIELEAGLRLSKITGLSEDIAIALRVPSVRIVAPIPGKNTVGIEIPNETRQVVRLRDVIEESDTKTAKMNIPVFLGKDVSGNPMVVDLAKMPHLLIAGRTGTGKSVCLNAIISSILMCCRPDEVRMLMIDPKMVELSGYGRLPHLMHPVIVDMKKAEAILAWAVEKMEERYSLLAKVGVRHINSFNALGREEILKRMEIEPEDDPKDVPDKLPFIVIIADEMADLMMTAGKDVEQHIIRIAQKSRAVGIHLILATQKPTVDVITGLIKSNLPARLSFQVASKTDSRVVLDENGADKLLGNGDMLFLWPGTSTLIRGQGTYLSDDEIDTVCAHCSLSEQNFVGELMNLKVAEEGGDEPSMENIKSRDELYDSAIEVVIREGRGSCSLLQRCLGIGYGRAAKLIDFMAEDKIVGDYNGSKAREVLMTMPQWQALQGLDVEDDEEEDEEEQDAVAEAEEEEYEDDESYEEVEEEEEEAGEEEYEDEEEEEEYEEYEEEEYEDETA